MVIDASQLNPRTIAEFLLAGVPDSGHPLTLMSAARVWMPLTVSARASANAPQFCPSVHVPGHLQYYLLVVGPARAGRVVHVRQLQLGTSVEK